MTALTELLLSSTQANYAEPVAAIAERWGSLLGEAPFAEATRQDLAARVAALVQTAPLDGPMKLQVLSDLFALTWWCGLEVGDDVYRTASEVARGVLCGLALQISRSRSPQHLPRAHAVFTECLQSPLHSPSRGAVDYVAALGTMEGVERIDIYHQQPVGPGMLEHMRARLGFLGDRVSLIANDGLTALGTAVERGPYVNHVWCEQPLAAHVSLLGLFGPTVMFTCGDEPPYQPADVYWYFHDADYVRASWASKGAPPAYTDNYVRCEAGPNTQERLAASPRAKADYGLGEDQVLLVSVGNRLSIEMDQSFITGMEATLRAHPNAVWLVVGPLPDYLVSACRQVLGSQFGHHAYERALPDLLAACDVFVNPFRRGGGDSATMAMANGVPVLTLCKGDVAAFAPPGHAAPTETAFFARLGGLIEDASLRSDWRNSHRARAEALADQSRFASELQAMVGLAWRRYRARSSAPVESAFGLTAASKAA